MTLVLVYAIVLTVGVLISAKAERSMLSVTLLFLLAGMAVGNERLDLVSFGPEDEVVGDIAKIALFAVLFTDGMRSSLPGLRESWQLPARALFSFPLTVAAIAGLAHWLVGLPWVPALLLGGVLSPTDPVLAAALVGHPGVRRRVRHVLNVESGLNDGLALPIVVITLGSLGTEQPGILLVLAEIVGGVALGVVVPVLLIRLERAQIFAAAESYQGVAVMAIGLLLLSVATLVHANVYLAGFVGGVTVATVNEHFADSFQEFGDRLTEYLKLLAVLVFASLLSFSFFADISISGWVFVVVVLLVVRTAIIPLVLVGSELTRDERMAVAWFGPKGFASVTFGLLVLSAGIEDGPELFHLTAAVVAGSILAHSTTDVVVAQRLSRAREAEEAAAAEHDEPSPEEQMEVESTGETGAAGDGQGDGQGDDDTRADHDGQGDGQGDGDRQRRRPRSTGTDEVLDQRPSGYGE